MKKIQQLLFAVSILLAISSVVLADDPFQANIIGFSLSGNYFAYEEFGINDDDNSEYSTIYIINVAKNSLAIAPFKAEGKWYRKSTYPGRRIYGKEVEKRLKIFGINEAYIGEAFTQSLMMENSSSDNPTPRPRNGETLPKEMHFTTDFGGSNREIEFEVTLSKILLPRENCSEFNRNMFSLETKINRQKGKSLTLQNNGNDSRNSLCADAYGIEEIMVYRNKFAILVAGLSKHSKGPDNRFLSVTGILPAK